MLHFRPPTTSEVLNRVLGTLEQPWHTGAEPVGTTVGTGHELDNLSVFLAHKEPNVIGVLPDPVTASLFGVIAHTEGTLLVVRGDVARCGWWTKESSMRGFATARIRGQRPRQSDDVHLVFDDHTAKDAVVGEAGPSLELRGQFSRVGVGGGMVILR